MTVSLSYRQLCPGFSSIRSCGVSETSTIKWMRVTELLLSTCASAHNIVIHGLHNNCRNPARYMSKFKRSCVLRPALSHVARATFCWLFASSSLQQQAVTGTEMGS